MNKDRRQEGRTPNKTPHCTPKPGKSLDNRTKDKLYNMAADLDVEGRSKRKKDDLISAIREKR